MKHEVWNNDVCDMYDAIRKEPTEFFPDHDEEDITDSMMWDEAYELVDQYLGDEKMNCDINKENHIILMGTLQRWDGGRAAYKDLGTCNIGEAFQKAISAWDGDNTFHIYVEGQKLLISQTGHDNPCSPSVMEFRVLKDYHSLDDMWDCSVENMRKHSKCLGREVRDVYGWHSRRKVVA